MNISKIAYTDAGWGLTILRIVTGVIFIGHGLPKFGFGGGPGLAGTAGFMESLGLPLPMLMAGLVASAETIGGLLLVIGFMARPAAFTQVIAMLVATFLVHWDNGLMGAGGYQWSLLMAAAAAAIMLEGAGKFSIDWKISG